MALAVAVILQHRIAHLWQLYSVSDSLRFSNDNQHAIERHLGSALLHT